MEDACWKCGSPGHHSRACLNPVDVDSNVRRQIQQHRFATGSSKRCNPNSFQEKMARKNKVLQAPLPKFELVRDEVGRVIDLLRTMDEEFDAIGNITVDVDGLECDIATLIPMKTQLNDLSHDLQELGWIIKKCKETWIDDEEVTILHHRGEIIQDMKKTLSDKCYVELNNKNISLKFMKDFIEQTSKLETWLGEVGNGRPLNVEDKKRFKSMKTEMAEMTNKFAYLFTANAQKVLEEKVNHISREWKKTVSRTKYLQDLENKLACLLCEDKPKAWALQCGHVFCDSCYENLKVPRTTDGIPFTDSWTGQVFTPQVQVPNACPICRKSLDGAIRLFF